MCCFIYAFTVLFKASHQKNVFFQRLITLMPFEDILKKTKKWSRLVHEATNPRIEDGAVHKVRHAIFDQFLFPPPVTLRHRSGDPPPESTSHISDPVPIFRSPSTKRGQKPPCTNSDSIVRGGFCPGFLSGDLCPEGFVRGGFCPSLFCQNPS